MGELIYHADHQPIAYAIGTHHHIGLDLATQEEVTIEGMSYAEIDFKVVLEPVAGYWLMMVPRSSTFKKWGIIQANGVGVIDPAYCGPTDTVKGLFYNVHPEDVTIPAGTRIVQIVMMPQAFATVMHKTATPERASRGGIGSTG